MKRCSRSASRAERCRRNCNPEYRNPEHRSRHPPPFRRPSRPLTARPRLHSAESPARGGRSSVPARAAGGAGRRRTAGDRATWRRGSWRWGGSRCAVGGGRTAARALPSSCTAASCPPCTIRRACPGTAGRCPGGPAAPRAPRGGRALEGASSGSGGRGLRSGAAGGAVSRGQPSFLMLISRGPAGLAGCLWYSSVSCSGREEAFSDTGGKPVREWRCGSPRTPMRVGLCGARAGPGGPYRSLPTRDIL